MVSLFYHCQISSFFFSASNIFFILVTFFLIQQVIYVLKMFIVHKICANTLLYRSVIFTAIVNVNNMFALDSMPQNGTQTLY